MNFPLYQKSARAAKMATTYLRKTENLGYASRAEGQPLPTEYWDVLEQALTTASEIVEMLPDDYFLDDEVRDVLGLGLAGRHNLSDAPLELGQKVMDKLVERRKVGARERRIALLRSTEGRTPEEAELYNAKAQELEAQR